MRNAPARRLDIRRRNEPRKPDERKKGTRRVVSTHVFGLTVATLADASRAARTVDHAVTLVDETSHMVVVVDQGDDATPGAPAGQLNRGPPRHLASYIQA
jgi:ABC-type branched-subunit amino acid transport system ATPase component